MYPTYGFALKSTSLPLPHPGASCLQPGGPDTAEVANRLVQADKQGFQDPGAAGKGAGRYDG